jgi:glutathione S-transferase
MKAPPMIRVHHLNNSRSQRVLWLLEELGLPYEVIRYERDPKTMLAPPELRRVHRLGKSPVIEDMDDGGRVVAETGAIVEYLVEKAGGRLGPPAHREAALRYRYWLHYAEASAMPPLLLKLVIDRLGLLGRPARPFVARLLYPQLDHIEAALGRHAWFAGDDFTAADVMMSFPVEAARSRAGVDARFPNMLDFLERIHARPAYGRALAAGGPYAYA